MPAAADPVASAHADPLTNSRFLRACRREPVDARPVWIMRQAGRYLPEYMDVRRQVTFIELCKRPDLAAEVTLSAQRVLGVDAAILFADLLPILEPMGMDLEYAQGEGPIIHNPVKTAAEVSRVKAIEDQSVLGFVFEAVKLIRRDLPAHIPLLGFAGAPFTLASYIIEGSGSRNYQATKTLMYTDRGAWNDLMDKLTRSLIGYLREQIAALAIGKLPTYRQREAAFQTLDQELKQRIRRRTDPVAWLNLIDNQKALSEFTGDLFIPATITSIAHAFRSEAHVEQKFQNVETALALAAWHSEHGDYPRSLADLVPKYLAEPPQDLFTNQPLHYERLEEGYRFYSFGFNEKDDGGRGNFDQPEEDDIVVRMPLQPPQPK